MKLKLLLWNCIIIFGFSLNAQNITERTRNMLFHKGYFNTYTEEKTGKVFLEIENVDTEFIYQTSLPSGLGSNDVGLDRGIVGETHIVKFNRVGNKVLMIAPNYRYRAVTSDAAEKRSVEQSFAQSVLWGFPVEAENGKSVLIELTPFLLRDAMNVINTFKNAQQGNYILDVSRSAMYFPRTKSFQRNNEFESTITFVNTDGKPGAYLASIVPAANSITLRMHHSFVQLPEKGYQTRVYDARSPYIPFTFYDYSSPVSEPLEKYYIIRHRLIKKNPELPKSEAVEPIVYYLDNGTPEPIRSALMEGAKWWNQAFETAGFINAFQVKLLPDSADPMDLRYNMINWVHRATRGWSFGYSVVDPRTGEIIKGNVTLGSLRVRQDYLIAQGMLSPYSAEPLTEDKMLKMSLQRLKQLAAHEIGHTLGLMHNYIASSQGRSSVMDYPSPVIKIKNGQIDLEDAYTNEIGSWDKVAIQYGYQQFNSNQEEQVKLDQLLKDATSNGLSFISDRDARDPAGLHPNAHLWDQGSDAVTNLREVMKVRNLALSNFGVNSIKKGTPMAMLEEVFVPVYLYHRYQIEAATKVVGGMYYTYAVKGDGQVVTKQLSKKEQLGALDAIVDCISPKNLMISNDIVKLIPPRPAGYEYHRELFHRRTGLSFDPLAAAETAADIPFSFLFNIERLNRMAENEKMYNGLGITEMIDRITSSFNTTSADPHGSLISEQNEQLLLTYLLAASINNDASFATKAAITSALYKLKNNYESQIKQKSSRSGYLLLALDRMKHPGLAKPTLHVSPPPGSPIGDGYIDEN